MTGTPKDDELRHRLQQAFNKDKNLAGYALSADVLEGEARIHGIVDALTEKQHAEKLAKSIDGIKSVENGITVSTDGKITGSDVQFEVNEELNADPNVRLKHVGAEVSGGGVVTLVGTTDDPDEVTAARKAAAKARGVTKVVSSVKVEEREMTPEELFHSQVRNDHEKKRV